jgi:hypothetical protein
MPLEAHALNVRSPRRKATPFPVIDRATSLARPSAPRSLPSLPPPRNPGYRFSVFGERSLGFLAIGASPRLRALAEFSDDAFLDAAEFARFFGAVLVFIVKSG